MPRTMPRSTAQITGCSMAAPPKGQCSDDDAQPVAVLLGVGGEAVGGEGVGHGVQRRAERPVRCVGARRRAPMRGHRLPYSTPTSSAIASACVGGQRRQRLAEEGDEQVVVADRQLERHLGRGRPGSASTAGRRPRRRAAGGDLEVATAGELVEVVAGDVGVEVEALGHLGGGDARRRRCARGRRGRSPAGWGRRRPR